MWKTLSILAGNLLLMDMLHWVGDGAVCDAVAMTRFVDPIRTTPPAVSVADT